MKSRTVHTGFAEMLKAEENRSRGRVFAKVPEWKDAEGLRFPTSLSTEQCSSSPTARYKASLVRPGSALADLTGGLGVDSWAYAKVCGKVLYNEMNPELHDAVRSNFNILGCSNVTTSCAKLEPGNIGSILGDFCPDVIFLDPARRSETGRKVFLLEDCSPDILAIKGELLDSAPTLMVKVSPMADISMLASRLGSELSEVHAVGSGGECKELLLILRRGNSRPWTVTVAECALEALDTLTFTPEEETAASVALPPEGVSLEGAVLFEPGSALMKSGCYRLLCSRYGLTKCGRFTHLYLCSDVPSELKPFGKAWRVLEQMSLDKRTMKDAGKRHPHCEVTARNVPFTSDEMRSRMGVSSGGSVHAFGITLDFASGTSTRLLLICVPL